MGAVTSHLPGFLSPLPRFFFLFSLIFSLFFSHITFGCFRLVKEMALLYVQPGVIVFLSHAI